jgi:predicted DNA-binding transcriptional regulator AlpA
MMIPGYLSIRQVREITSLGRATIYREIAKGRFPKQHDLSPGRVGWAADEVAAWNESRRSRPDSNQPPASAN